MESSWNCSYMAAVLQAEGGGFGIPGNLKDLTLNGNALTSLPDTISGLKSLKALTLQHNKLTELPSTVSSLTVSAPVSVSMELA